MAVRVGTAVGQRVRVDPIRCDGHGVCAELFPERITLDDWGYPIVDPRPLTPSLEKHAERAAAADMRRPSAMNARPTPSSRSPR